MRQPRTILWRLAGVLLTVAIVFSATAQRTQAQDLTTLLANFLRQLYAGKIVIPTTADSSSYSVLDIATTWNTAGNTPTAIKLNVTDTASNAASLLLDLQVGGTSQFKVSKAGTVTAGTITGYRFAATYGTATDSSPVFNGSQTWNDAADVFTGLLVNVTDTASAAASLLMDLQVGGASKFSVSKAGIVTTASSIAVSATASYGFLSRGYIQAEATGVFTLLNAATTDFNRLQFGGTTSSFPSLKRVGTAITARLADDSGDAQLNGSVVYGSIMVQGTYVNAGAANFASTGAIRLANNTAVNWRNAANDADIGGWSVNASNALVIGNAVTPASSGTRFLCISTAGVITSSASACSGT